MKKASCAVLCMVAMAVVLLLGELHVSEAVTCNPSQLSPCLGAVKSGQPPSAACCQKLREQKPCLCGYLKNPSLRPYLTSPNAKKVASSCGVQPPNC